MNRNTAVEPASTYIALLDLPTPEYPISQRFARRLRYEHRVPSYKVGGRIHFLTTDLTEYIESTRTEAN